MKRIVLAGGSGFLGRILAEHFRVAGWEAVTLTRRPKREGEVHWDGKTKGEWARLVDGAEAVVNLAGKSVNCRYTPKNQSELVASRIEPTRVLGEVIAGCAKPPRVWMNSSTATIYKHTFGAAWDESGEIGPHPDAKDEFSLQIATEWERVFFEAVTPNTRKVALRSSMVLGRFGNSVFPMLRRLTRLGLGGRMGSGKQFVSWIHERDFCRAIEWIVEHEELAGPINVAAPNPLTNAEMMRILRRVVGMPIGLPAEEWMLEVGAFLMRTETELIIKSRRVVPRRLLESGFRFEFETIEPALRELNAAMAKA